MAIQNNFYIDHLSAYVGMVVDGQLSNTVSRTNTDTATIPFGAPVFGEGKSTGTLLEFVGIAIREIANRDYMPGTIAGYEVGKTISVLSDGVIYVTAPAGTLPNTPVYIVAGALANTGTDDELLAGAKWLSVDGDIAKLKLTIGA